MVWRKEVNWSAEYVRVKRSWLMAMWACLIAFFLIAVIAMERDEEMMRSSEHWRTLFFQEKGWVIRDHD
jgi:hypothetical protein